ncbi:MAG: WYL domain-containing protein [Oscillospiraceae bacterium]|nr:WYL domain-containing protein [Oscillospiraceae bacterium]
MTLFHEMYGAYFRIAARVLDAAPLTDRQVNEIVAAEGFRDSVLFVPQKLLPQADGSDWGLLRRNPDGTLAAVTKHKPVMPLTLLQKRWLKARLSDPKMQLFFDDETFAALTDALADVSPLWQPELFRYTDRFSDGDPFTEPAYRAHFRALLHAIRTKAIVQIRFQTGGGRRIAMQYLPLAIEYSRKNDKFRLYCRSVRGNRLAGSGIINLGRIEQVTETGRHYDGEISLTEYFQMRRNRTHVTVRVTTERNAVERFLMEFASYEKHTERDAETGTLTVKLYYDKQDETELLIQLLSFGPVLEILGPPDFRAQAAERVLRQYELLGLNKEEQDAP